MRNGEKATQRLAVDAQILIRALLPSRTRELFQALRGRVTLVTTPGKIAEIKRWLPSIARKRGLDADLLMSAVVKLPVEVIAETRFQKQIEAAQEQIGDRDPSDVDLLALALAENIPIWSDDRDFEDSSAQVFRTEAIIAKLNKEG